MDEPVLEMTDKTRLISIAVLISLEIILGKKEEETSERKWNKVRGVYGERERSHIPVRWRRVSWQRNSTESKNDGVWWSSVHKTLQRQTTKRPPEDMKKRVKGGFLKPLQDKRLLWRLILRLRENACFYTGGSPHECSFGPVISNEYV